MEESTETDKKSAADMKKSDSSKAVNSDEKQKDILQPDNSKPKPPKAKKRKKPKDSTAPRQPLTGYIRFLNDRREAVRAANPTQSFAEITKILASEWSNLPPDKKQQYLDAAEQDRERYTKEYEAYKQTEAYKQFTQQQNEKKIKESKDKEEKSIAANTNTQAHQTVVTKDTQEMDYGNFDIPIFTEEFLDHNKTRDAELRQLRKINTDYEQQNSILSKHIENMKSAITKLETEIMQQEKTNSALQQHLDHLRTTLAGGFGSVKLPDNFEDALVKLKKAEETSDLTDQEEISTITRKRKIFKPARLIDSSSSNDDDDDKRIVRKLPPPPKIHASFSDDSNRKSAKDLDSQSSGVIPNRQTSTLTLASGPRNCSESVTLPEKTCFQVILENLIEIKNQNKVIVSKLTKLVEAGEPKIDSEQLPVKLPIKNIDDLNLLEHSLPNHTHILVTYFRGLGGDSITSKTNRILKTTLDDTVAVEFNFFGRNKRPFNNLKICSCIIDAVKSSSGCTSSEVENAIKIWLKHAAQRLKAKNKH